LLRPYKFEKKSLKNKTLLKSFGTYTDGKKFPYKKSLKKTKNFFYQADLDDK
jgi:hypothetical protein